MKIGVSPIPIIRKKYQKIMFLLLATYLL